MRRRFDVIVIGAGPGGLAAAIEAKKHGADDVLLIDRDLELGGILLQCIHNGFGLHRFREELTGPEYAQRDIDEAQALELDIRTGTTVLDITPDKLVTAVSRERGIQVFAAKAVILAMGCRERPRGALAIPGSRPAGVFSAGTAQKLVNMAEDISRAFGQTFADLLTGAATVEDAFESLGNTIIATMAQKMIADPITNAMMGAFGGLFGAPVMHSGGVVGQTATPVRIVNSSIFAGAPRLHTGLRADEYPAILKRGEQVIPKRESEFMASAPNVSFNITNQSGAQVDVQQTGVQWDGRRMIVGMVLKDKRNNGPMARANRRR